MSEQKDLTVEVGNLDERPDKFMGDYKTVRKKNMMIHALERSLGVVSKAAKHAGISHWTHKKWLKEDPLYANMVEDMRELVLDFAESKLHEQVNKNNVIATIFLLKTLGKSRGYIERQEIDHTSKGERIKSVNFLLDDED